MNTYGIAILVTVLVAFALEVLGRWLDLRALDPNLPREFERIYDRDKYSRSQEYTRSNTRFSLVERSFDVAAFLAFWGAGGFGWLDVAVRGLGLGVVTTGLAYIGVLVLGRWILALPFEWYSTFVLEERFGFNRTTRGVFIADRLKACVLGVVIAGPLLALVLRFFAWAGPGAWLWCWLVVTAFSIVLQLVVPVWILPLFNRFVPLEEGELRRAIVAYAERVGFPLANVFVVDGSKRSGKSNAFFAGIGRTKRLALYDTLVEQQSVGELVAVVAHEVGHYEKRHILQSTAISIAHSGALLWLLSIFLSREGLYDAFGVEGTPVYAGLVLFGLLFSPIELVLSIGYQALSRRNEYQADRFAVETTGDGEALVRALQKLAADNLVNLTPHPFRVFLEYSHPPMLERIRAIRAVAAEATRGA